MTHLHEIVKGEEVLLLLLAVVKEKTNEHVAGVRFHVAVCYSKFKWNHCSKSSPVELSRSSIHPQQLKWEVNIFSKFCSFINIFVLFRKNTFLFAHVDCQFNGTCSSCTSTGWEFVVTETEVNSPLLSKLNHLISLS